MKVFQINPSIIFWQITMFQDTCDSPQVKFLLISISDLYELHHELPHLGLRILENKEILGK